MTDFADELNRFDEQKLSEYRKGAAQLAQGMFPLPRQITFFPTYHCNHACPGCLYHSHQGYWTGAIGWGDFQRIAATLARIGVERIEVSGGGEPSCHPRFRELLIELTRRAPQVGVISNGSAFSGDDLLAMVRHATYIRLSLDSLNADTYRQLHGRSAQLRKTLDNLNTLTRLKRELKSRLVIGVKFLITRDNAAELRDMLAWGRQSGLDHIQFKAIRQAASELDAATAAQLDATLQRAKRANTAPTAIYGSLLPIRSRVRCWTAPLHAVVDPLGDLYVCCYFHGRRDELRIGNILQDAFETVWGSAAHRRLLAAIQMERCVHDCRFKMYNELLRAP